MFCALRVFQPESLAESNRPTTQSFPRPRETAKLNIAIGLQSNAPYISARKSAVLGRDGGFSFADLQHPPRVIHYLSRGSSRPNNRSVREGGPCSRHDASRGGSCLGR